MQVILSLLVLFFVNTVSSQNCDVNLNIHHHKRFRDFQPGDAGNYSCRIFRGGGRFFTCNFVVNVPENPTVTLPENSSGNSLGGQVTISTVIDFGRPRGTFEWLHQGVPLVLNARISTNNSTGSLTISNIQSSDRGRYTIRVMNEHGTDSANYGLTVFYLDVPILNEVSSENGRVRISCTVTGQWTTLNIAWTPTPASIGGVNPPTVIDDFTRRTIQTADLEISNCVAYRCVVSDDRAGSANSPPFQSCSGLQARNSTAVVFSWSSRPGATYQIRYGLSSRPAVRMVTAVVSSGPMVIGGLMAGMTYVFELGTIDGSPDPVYSNPESITLDPCPDAAETPSRAVTNVGATILSQNERRRVKLWWDPSMESGVTGYRVRVSSVPPQSFIVKEPPFLLDPSYCNGQTYSYSVEAVNECNLGSSPVTVATQCSNIGSTQIYFSVVSIGDTTLTFQVDVNSSRVKRDAPVKLLVNTILPNKDNIRLISTYQIMTYVKTVCITDLTKNTFYNICLCTDFVDGIQNSNEKICMQNMTSNTADPEANSCFKATSTSTEKVEGTGSAVHIPDWAIAVIVVCILAMVALVFCFIGVYYACSSNKSKEYIYGSTLLLQASSVNMPHNMHNVHRSVSPPRRCLKVDSTIHNEVTSSLMKTNEANDSCTPDISGVEGGLMTTNVAYGTHAEPDISGVEGGLMTTNVSYGTHAEPDISGVEGGLMTTNVSYGTHAEPDISGVEGGLMTTNVAYGTHAEPDISGIEGALMTTNIAYGSHGENLFSGTTAQDSGDMTENIEHAPIRDGTNFRSHSKRAALEPVLIPNALNHFYKRGLISGNQENLEAVHEARNVSLSISEEYDNDLEYGYMN